jgi:hypothetical protein
MPKPELALDPLEQNLGWLVDQVTAGSHEYVSKDDQPIIFRVSADAKSKGIIFHSHQVPGVDLILGEDYRSRVYFADEDDGLKRQQGIQRALTRLHMVLNATADSRVRKGFGNAVVHKRFDDESPADTGS